MSESRRVLLGWMVAAAAAAAAFAVFEVGSMSRFQRADLRSEHAEGARGIPPGMTVVVAEDGKTFHLSTCTFIHDRARSRTTTAAQAIEDGYTPCIRCLKKYVAD